MNAPLVLAAYALTGAVVVAPLLASARWVDRAPRLGLLAWQALTGSVVAAAVLAALAVALPVVSLSTNLAELLRACAMMLRHAYATPGGAFTATVGLLVAAGIALRAGYGITAEWVRAVLDRRRHLAVLAMVGTGDDRLGVTVVDHDASAAYCLPGRGGHVVLTTAALEVLDGPQVAAVLAHERAHLRGRHHLMVAAARGMERAFPFVGVFALARTQVDRLTELAADDAAATATDRLTVAEALLVLARGNATREETGSRRPPATALAAERIEKVEIGVSGEATVDGGQATAMGDGQSGRITVNRQRRVRPRGRRGR